MKQINLFEIENLIAKSYQESQLVKQERENEINNLKQNRESGLRYLQELNRQAIEISEQINSIIIKYGGKIKLFTILKRGEDSKKYGPMGNTFYLVFGTEEFKIEKFKEMVWEKRAEISFSTDGNHDGTTINVHQTIGPQVAPSYGVQKKIFNGNLHDFPIEKAIAAIDNFVKDYF